MIKTLKNISKEDQLVMTISGKQVVPAGEQFATEKAEELLRNYKYLFVEVNEDEIEKVEKEKRRKLRKQRKKSQLKRNLQNK